jgi:hypothetical protein
VYRAVIVVAQAFDGNGIGVFLQGLNFLVIEQRSCYCQGRTSGSRTLSANRALSGIRAGREQGAQSPGDFTVQHDFFLRSHLFVLLPSFLKKPAGFSPVPAISRRICP